MTISYSFAILFLFLGKSKIEEIVNHKNFWEDPNKARITIKELEFIRSQIAFWNNLNIEINNLNELYQLSTNEKESGLLDEINNKYNELHKLFVHKEIVRSIKFQRGRGTPDNEIAKNLNLTWEDDVLPREASFEEILKERSSCLVYE